MRGLKLECRQVEASGWTAAPLWDHVHLNHDWQVSPCVLEVIESLKGREREQERVESGIEG